MDAQANRSDAYHKLVSEEESLLRGALAYAMYKQEKLEYIRRNNLEPNDPRIREYHNDLNEGRVDTLRGKADAKIRAFADDVIAQTQASLRREIEEEYKSGIFSVHANHLAAIRSEIADTKAAVVDTKNTVISGTQLWKSVLAGVTASIVFGLVLSGARIIDWQNPFNELVHKPAQTQLPAGK